MDGVQGYKEKTSRKEAGDLAGEELEKDRRARASEGGKAAAESREAPGSDRSLSAAAPQPRDLLFRLRPPGLLPHPLVCRSAYPARSPEPIPQHRPPGY